MGSKRLHDAVGQHVSDQSISDLLAADVICAAGDRLLDPGYLFYPRGVFLEGERHESVDLLVILGVFNLVLLVLSSLLHDRRRRGSSLRSLDAQQNIRKFASLSLP